MLQNIRFILKDLTIIFVFFVSVFPAVAANPILTFYTVATESGFLVFRWVDEAGVEAFDKVELEVV